MYNKELDELKENIRMLEDYISGIDDKIVWIENTVDKMDVLCIKVIRFLEEIKKK